MANIQISSDKRNHVSLYLVYVLYSVVQTFYIIVINGHKVISCRICTLVRLLIVYNNV